jgi:hypothetical protein
MEFSINKANKSRDIILIFLIVLIALLIRRTDAFTNPQLWAEDGAIYFQQYEQYGIKSLVMVYGGYLHFVPRLISTFWGILHVNYLYIPICYSISVFFVTFFIALNIWKTSAYLNIQHRILYATSFLFLPVASEIFMNLTNINWITGLYLINFLFVRYTDYTSKNTYLNLLVIFIISLSGPFAALMSPLILLVIIVERKELTFRKFIPLGLILLGGIIGYICLGTQYFRPYPAQPEQYHLFKLITNNTSLLLFSKYSFMQWVPPFIMMLISFITFLALLCIFIARYIKIDNKRRYILLAYAIIVFMAFVHAYWPNESHVLAMEIARYYFIPFTCIGWLMLLSFDKKIKPLYIAIYLVFFSIQLHHSRMVLPDREWKKQVLEYYDGKRQQIDINPEGWQIVLPPKK